MTTPPILVSVLSLALAAAACGSNATTPEQDAAAVLFPVFTNFPSTAEADATPVGGRFSLLTGQEESLVLLQLFAANGSLGHDHIIRAGQLSVETSFSWADLGACQLNVTVPVAELTTDEDDLRSRAGLDGTIPKSQRDLVKQHMQAKNQLDAETFKDITFQATRCATSGQNGAGGHPVVNVEGTLNIRGVAKAVTLPLEIATRGDTLAARGRLTLQHSDFGMEPYNQANLFKNKPEIYVQLDVRARRQ